MTFEGFTVYQYISFGCLTFIYLVFCYKLGKDEKAALTPKHP